MNTLALVRFLSDCADEAINRAASMETGDVHSLLDEAEELIALASQLIHRDQTNVLNISEAT
tara:strand:- start:292 stop:477 length:186 start_codon:yes stop_codon:yes gene_type:complete